MKQYPADDSQFEETTLRKANREGGGWVIERGDSFSFFVQDDSPVEPKAGMTARFYGAGLGHAVRGLFLDGTKVFYRTEAEDKEKHEIDFYGADAEDWLKRWDEDRTVWSIEMGGLGPGYEQCIHITCAEILRVMLDRQFDVTKWEEAGAWKKASDEIEKSVMALPKIKDIGLSGAQWGGAMNLAAMFYRHGPRHVMTDERVKDRHIQVQRTFPSKVSV